MENEQNELDDNFWAQDSDLIVAPKEKPQPRQQPEDDDDELPVVQGGSKPIKAIKKPSKVQNQTDLDLEDEDEVSDEEFFPSPEAEAKKAEDAKKVKEKEKADPEEDDEDEETPKPKAKDEDKKKKDEDKSEGVIPTDEEESKKFFTTVAKELQEREIFSIVKLEEDEELDEDGLYNKIEEEVDGRFNEAIENYKEEVTPLGVEFLNYTLKGGRNVAKFLETYAQTELPLTEDELDTEPNQLKFLKYSLKKIEKIDDEEELEDRIKYLKENGKIEKTSKNHFKILDTEAKAQRDKLIADAEKAEKAAEDARKARLAKLTKVIETESIKGVKLSAEDKKTLPSYITNPSVKKGAGKYTTQMWADIEEAMKDPETLVLLAKVLKSKFNMSVFGKQEVTKKTKEIKSSLQNFSRGGKNLSGMSSGSSGKSLADALRNA